MEKYERRCKCIKYNTIFGFIFFQENVPVQNVFLHFRIVFEKSSLDT